MTTEIGSILVLMLVWSRLEGIEFSDCGPRRVHLWTEICHVLTGSYLLTGKCG